MRVMVKKISHGRFQFVLIARGRVVATRRTPARQDSATEVIAVIRNNALSRHRREK